MFRKHDSGFTLIELIVTIAVLAIVSMYAIPSFREVVMNNRLTAQTNEVTSLISYARSEASKVLGGVVTVCGSTDGATCSGNNALETGIIIFYDEDMDRTLDGSDELLKVQGALGGGNSLRIRGMTSSGGNYIQFDSKGFPRSLSVGDDGSGTFIICDERGAGQARAVSINASGQAYLARDTDDNGILNDYDGNDISCP
ncbi:type IV fimbrial biogenesis protein FimT [Marinobacter persicus]|uniref:Type II secretion system protein H n=1 Tax=Marinobacter persicus TaxID=930118 RepID=A0A1I3X2U3_9GAMM|nr:GspH/FimT family pseudopilin [Marinobacter persicus]GHD48545.1 pre-pilin like leader sequence [Marinobacter persicus]SFK14112.1 type IV fimbrial biogenesis protein FimT [Marinobacter persicus]